MGAGDAVERQLSQAEDKERSHPLVVEPELELEIESAFELRRAGAPATPNSESLRKSVGLDSDPSVPRRATVADGPEARDCASLRLPIAILRPSSLSLAACDAASSCEWSEKLWERVEGRRAGAAS